MIAIEELYQIFLRHPQVQTDTRKLRPGELFFALRGPHFDGNKFAEKALESGASYAVVDAESLKGAGSSYLYVPDVLEALQQLAAFHRNQFQIPFLAITGSNGKTTTKELTNAVLSTTFKTHATRGNLNNHIGIPLTLLQIKKGVEIALIEMGANHQREIAGYCEIVRPTHGIITNVGKAHLEGFGGIEGVKKGKGELFDFLRAEGGTVFACADFPYFEEMSKGIKDIHWYGTSRGLPSTGEILQREPTLTVRLDGKIEVETHLAGAYNLYNILAAKTIGAFFGVKSEDIRRAIQTYIPRNGRSQIVHKGSNTILLDAYNANPSSMKAAIKDFAQRKGDKKCLYLGAMLELGKESIKEHQELVDYLRQYGWKDVVLVGGDFENTHRSYPYFPTVEEAKKFYESRAYEDTLFLIKGSRGIQMEKLLDPIV